MDRTIREANELLDLSREQLEAMRRQTDQALEQAERMNDLLARVVKLTEPLERAQRGGEYVGERLKRALFGPEGFSATGAMQAEPIAGQEAAEIIAEEAAAEAILEEAEEREAPPAPEDEPER